MNVPDSVSQDGEQWYFWDETGTQFLGPFHSESDARDAAKEYGEYLSTGVYSSSLAQLAWKDGESAERLEDCSDSLMNKWIAEGGD